jgi:hypothetical protein
MLNHAIPDSCPGDVNLPLGGVKGRNWAALVRRQARVAPTCWKGWLALLFSYF